MNLFYNVITNELINDRLYMKVNVFTIIMEFKITNGNLHMNWVTK